MSYANGTTHYNLPQTVGSDKRDWSDTNTAFANVDSALHTAVSDSATAITNAAAAQSTANTANTKATNAQTAATNAGTAAASASELATTAKNRADSAYNLANAANTMANTANTRLNSVTITNFILSTQTIQNAPAGITSMADLGEPPANTWRIPVNATRSGRPVIMGIQDSRYFRVVNDSNSSTDIIITYLEITLSTIPSS